MSEAHICPVCGGKGLVPNGFYNAINTSASIQTTPETCRSCGGHGYIILPSSTSFTVKHMDLGEQE